MDPKELRRQAAEKIRAAGALLSAADEKGLSEEQKAEWTKLHADAKALQNQAEMAETQALSEGALACSTGHIVSGIRERGEDDPKFGFKTPRDFMAAVIQAGRSGRTPDNLRALTVGSDEHGVYDDTRGGFFVPSAFLPGILAIDPEQDPMAGRVQALPMSAPKVTIPARVDKDHRTSVSGGFVVYRRNETSTVTASRGQYEQVVMIADTLMGVSYATEELLNDSAISFAAIIERGFQDAFMFKLIKERLSGTGVGMFMGILNSPALVTVDKENAQSNGTINGTNILKMRARCYGYNNAIWLANPDTYLELAGAHITGTNTDVFLFSPARGEDVPDMLLGRPVIFTEYAKTLGYPGDLILADWSQYLEGTYQPVQNATSIHVRFLEHEQCFKMWLRNAGAPWWNTTLTPVESSTTMSPFIVLAARHA